MNPVPQPISALDYLMKMREQRQAQTQNLMQMLPPIGANAASMPAFQFARPEPMQFPQAAPMPTPPTPVRSPAPAPSEPPAALPASGAAPLPLRRDMQVAGYDDAIGSYGTAQQYADKFAGGDLGKVKARTIFVDGQPINDFYTRGLFDAAMPSPTAPAAPAQTEDPNFLQRIFGLFSLPSLGG